MISPSNIAADTNIGLVRECNEDTFVYSCESRGCNTLVGVFDGIGGHDSGDVASFLCASELLVRWKKSRFHTSESIPDIESFLKRSITYSNEKIYNLNSAFNIEHPMGTTVVSAVFLEGQAVVAHAGDSRLYRLRNGLLEQLTTDHSYISEMLRNKLITPEEARKHPLANVISKSVGPCEHVEPEIKVYPTQTRDRYVFCTDGVSNYLEDIEIETVVYDANTPRTAVRNLIYSTLRNGGDDNLTAVCVFIP